MAIFTCQSFPIAFSYAAPFIFSSHCSLDVISAFLFPQGPEGAAGAAGPTGEKGNSVSSRLTSLMTPAHWRLPITNGSFLVTISVNVFFFFH